MPKSSQAATRVKITDLCEWHKIADLGWQLKCKTNGKKNSIGMNIGFVYAKNAKGKYKYFIEAAGDTDHKDGSESTLALAKRCVEQWYFHGRKPLAAVAAEKAAKLKKNPPATQSMLKTLKDARNHAIKAENLLASYCPELIPQLSKVIKKLEKFIEGK